MWYPLKNSVYTLSIAAMALMVLLAVGRPVPPANLAIEVDGDDHARTVLAVESVLPHLLIADAGEHARIARALRQAAAAVRAELHAQPHSDWRNRLGSGRRQAAMPFFSFGSLLDRSREPSA